MFRFEGYTLDIACGALRSADRNLDLRPKAFEVLRYLLENADRIVTKEELMKAVWPNVIVTDQALTHCVGEVRQAIGDSEQTLIKNIPRRGYRFTAPVLRIAAAAAAVSPDSGPRSQSPPLDRPSVAVLPFANLSCCGAARGIRTPDPIITKREIGSFGQCTIVRSSTRKYVAVQQSIGVPAISADVLRRTGLNRSAPRWSTETATTR